MITPTTINDYVQRHVKRMEWLHKKDTFVIPKKAKVKHATLQGQRQGYLTGKTLGEQGRAYAHDTNLQRAVFFPEPIKTEEGSRYKEIKGYGANGQELFPWLHDEGDLKYGMYTDNAQREHENLAFIQTLPESRTQQALAYLEFCEGEFIHHSLNGLAGIISNSRDRTLGKTKKEVRANIQQTYERKGFEEVRTLCTPVLEATHFNPRTLRNLFLDVDFERGAGYLVRAVRAPFRIGSWKELGMSQEDMHHAAHEAGKTYSAMLQKGLLHLIPGEGNITIAGELMDAEDVERVTTHEPIQEFWNYCHQRREERRESKEKEIGRPVGGPLTTFEDFLAYTLGEDHRCQPCHTEPFLDGIGLGRTPRQVARAVIEMHEEAFRPLLVEKIKS